MDFLHRGNHQEVHNRGPSLDKYNKEALELAKKAVWRRKNTPARPTTDSGEIRLWSAE